MGRSNTHTYCALTFILNGKGTLNFGFTKFVKTTIVCVKDITLKQKASSDIRTRAHAHAHTRTRARTHAPWHVISKKHLTLIFIFQEED